jgi:hypothetical protein
VVANGACTHREARVDETYFFLWWWLTVDLWESLYITVLSWASNFPPDWDWLMLAFPKMVASE